MAQFDDYEANKGAGRAPSLSGIGSAIRGTLDQHKLHEHLRPHQALALWPEIAGEQIAAVCTAEAVRCGVLFVRARSSVWANELTFYKPDLLARLNKRLGGRIIEDIHFSTGARSRAAKTTPPKPAAEVRDLSKIAPPSPPAASVDPQARLDALVERTKSVLAWKRENGWVPCVRCGALFEQPPPAAKPKGGARRPKGRAASAGDGICPVCRALMSR